VRWAIHYFSGDQTPLHHLPNETTHAQLMLIGQLNTLELARFTDNGAYLEDEDREEVLLPNAYLTEDMDIGKSLEVFVYTDSEDRLVASTLRPKAMVGELAVLETKAATEYGAFLDWGLPKDLFLPFRQMVYRPRVGQNILVAVYADDRSNRVAATMKVDKFFNRDTSALERKTTYNGVVYGQGEQGYRVLLEGQYQGMIFREELGARRYLEGDEIEVHIKHIRDDGRLDLRIGSPGFSGVEEAADVLWAALNDADGFLALTDDSSPDLIERQTRLSKKTFKRALGTLMKAGAVNLTDRGIERR